MTTSVRFAVLVLAFTGVPARAQVPNPDAAAPARTPEPVDVRVVADEADAALAILAKRAAGEAVTDADREALFATEGFGRLEARARSLDREVDRDAFVAWLVSDSVVSRTDDFREAIAWWKDLDASAPGRKALAYLPAGAVVRAKLYPVIKPQTNSYVFEIREDPAIFLYVDPDEAGSKIANTLAHELHHVGTAGVPDCAPAGVDTLPEAARTAVDWLSGFGEGLAVLAAAGGPDVHPHAGRDDEEYVVWERDVANANADLAAMDRFFLDVAEGRLTDEAEIRSRGFGFIATEEIPQGAFYTLGWKMAAVVEKAEGREVVIASVCDPRLLLAAWNRVAAAHAREDGEGLASWSPALMRALGSPGH